VSGSYGPPYIDIMDCIRTHS